MANRRKKPPKMWIYSPPKSSRPKVPDDLKAGPTEKAETLLQEWRPQYIKPPPPGYQFNYIVELYGSSCREASHPSDAGVQIVRGGPGYPYRCRAYAHAAE